MNKYPESSIEISDSDDCSSESPKDKRCTTLDIDNVNCVKAFECCPDWCINKVLVVDGKDRKEAKVCIFDGDSVKVNYEIKATREQQGPISVVWPLLLTNIGKTATKGLKVGAKITSKNNQSIIIDGFESQHPVLEPHQSFQYIISGIYNPSNQVDWLHISITGVTTIDNWCKRGHRWDGPDASAKVEVETSEECKRQKIVIKDKALDVTAVVPGNKTSRTIKTGGLLTPGENIDCGDTFVNKAILFTRKVSHRCRDDCDDISCKQCKFDDDNGASGNKKVSKAKIKVKCAKVVLDCNSNSEDCVDNWCLCSQSQKDISKDGSTEIHYKIKADRIPDKNAIACLGAKISLEGCAPAYSKEFTLKLIKCDEDWQPCDSGAIIDEVKFELGGDSPDTFVYQNDSKNKSQPGKIWKFDKEKDTGKFLFVLTYDKCIFNLSTFETAPKDCPHHHSEQRLECMPKLKSCAKIINDLTLSDKCDVKIVDIGSFACEEDIKDFLRGKPLTICDTTKIKFFVVFKPHHSKFEVVNKTILKSTIKGNNHSNEVVSIVSDTVGLGQKDDRHRDDKDDCNIKTRRHHSSSSSESESDECKKKKKKHRKHKTRRGYNQYPFSGLGVSISESSSSYEPPTNTGKRIQLTKLRV